MLKYSESRLEQITVRGLRYAIRHWGETDAPMLFFLHGWMDSSATFQFVVEALLPSWHIIAPDWRGYGESEWLSRPYYFPDYYADLDVILEHYAGDKPVSLVGHSMGANIAGIYASARPERVTRLVMLDFLGLKPEIDAPGALDKWLTAIRTEPKLRAYRDYAALAQRLIAVNPRLHPDRAAFLSRFASRIMPDGLVTMACDPWHKVSSPIPYRVEDAKACWRKIAAPVLLVIAEQGFVQQRLGNDPEEYRSRLECFTKLNIANIANSGHNLQHDQPEQLALLLEEFLPGT